MFPRASGSERLGAGCEVQCPGRITGVSCRSPSPTVPADPWVFVSQRVVGHHGDAATRAPQPPLRSLGSFPPSPCCRCCGCGFPRLCGGSGTAFKCLRPRFPGIRMGPPPAAVYQRVKKNASGVWGGLLGGRPQPVRAPCAVPLKLQVLSALLSSLVDTQPFESDSVRVTL